jgi:hypothetical protein
MSRVPLDKSRGAIRSRSESLSACPGIRTPSQFGRNPIFRRKVDNRGCSPAERRTIDE